MFCFVLFCFVFPEVTKSSPQVVPLYFWIFDRKDKCLFFSSFFLSFFFFQSFIHIEFFFLKYMTERTPFLCNIPLFIQRPLFFVIVTARMPLTLTIGALHPRPFYVVLPTGYSHRHTIDPSRVYGHTLCFVLDCRLSYSTRRLRCQKKMLRFYS